VKITLLDALSPGTASDAIRDALADAGVLHAAHRLREERFAPCQGCFECWVDHPGTCKAKDAANEIMPDVIAADVVLWVTAPRFACWDPVAKVALDKSIGLLSPFFEKVDGETHHRKRYPRYPRWAVIAVTDAPVSPDARDAFELLVARNALNLRSSDPWVGWIPPAAGAGEVRRVVQDGLQILAGEGSEDVPHVEPPAARADAVGVAPTDRPRHVVSWVGSAKPAGISVSEAFAAALEARLVRRGWTAERVHALRVTKLGRDASESLVEAARRADLLVLAAPVYWDSLPSLVLAGLAHLVDAKLGAEAPALLPIVQCGFPEPAHTALAIEVAWRAAREAGWPWAGHLAMGGGGATQGEIDSTRGKLRHQVAALDAAAEALDAGDPVPASATEGFATPLIPGPLYRAMGNTGWVAMAVGEGLNPLRLGHRPFEST